MADYCYQCTEKLIGISGDKNDLKGLSTPADTAKGIAPVVLCEGCGPIQVNHLGVCISKDCFEKHGA